MIRSEDRGSSDVGIGTTCLVLGEREVSVAELARTHGTSEAAITRSLGRSAVRVASTTEAVLAIRAGRACLERAGVDPGSIDVLIRCGGRLPNMSTESLRIQHEVGAVNAFAVDVGQDCSEMLTSWQVARGLIVQDPSINRVLVVSGEVFGDEPLRGRARITETSIEDLYSDGGAAVLIERGGKLRLLGFGSASVGQFWYHSSPHPEAQAARASAPATDAQVLISSIPLYPVALRRCLASAGVELADVQHVVLPMDAPRVADLVVRASGIPADKFFWPKATTSHIGAADPVLWLEALQREKRVAPGARVLVCAMAYGLVRFALLQT